MHRTTMTFMFDAFYFVPSFIPWDDPPALWMVRSHNCTALRCHSWPSLLAPRRRSSVTSARRHEVRHFGPPQRLLADPWVQRRLPRRGHLRGDLRSVRRLRRLEPR